MKLSAFNSCLAFFAAFSTLMFRNRSLKRAVLRRAFRNRLLTVAAEQAFRNCFRKKAGIAVAGSKRFSAFSLSLSVFLLPMASASTFTPYRASMQVTSGIKVDIEAFHITAAEGAKALGQLRNEQNPSGAPLPTDQYIAGFQIVVGKSSSPLEFTKIEGNNSPGWQFEVAPGENVEFSVSKLAQRASQAISQYSVKTSGTCNFLLFIKFHPLTEPIPAPPVITAAIRIAAPDGERNLADLVRERDFTIPSQYINSIQLAVGSSSNPLIVSKMEMPSPAGFQMVVSPGKSMKCNLPRLNLGPTALSKYSVKTQGTSNFILAVEFAPTAVITAPTPAPIITAAIRMNVTDGEKNLADLVRQRGFAIPNQYIHSIQLAVGSTSSPLIISKVEAPSPVGFQVEIPPGKNIKFPTPRFNLGPTALSKYSVKTQGPNSFILVIDFEPL